MRLAALRLFAVLLFLAAALGAQPGLTALPAHDVGIRGEVLVVSELDMAYDSNVMATLDRVLRDHDGVSGYRVTRHQLASDSSEAQALAEVQKMLQMQPWRLVIATSAWSASLVRSTGTNLPLLFRSADHPVRMCLVDSMRRPGQHATGFTSNIANEMKMIEALRLAYTGLRSVVILYDTSSSAAYPSCPQAAPMPPCQPGFVDDAQERTALLSTFTDAANIQRAASLAHVEWRLLRLCTKQDLDKLDKWLPRTEAHQPPRDAVVVPYHDLFFSQAETLVSQLNRQRLPTIYAAPYFLSLGGLMAMRSPPEPAGAAWGIDLAPRILAGEPAGSIPVQQPDGVELLINLRAAKALDLPPSKAALRAADRLIR